MLFSSVRFFHKPMILQSPAPSVWIFPRRGKTVALLATYISALVAVKRRPKEKHHVRSVLSVIGYGRSVDDVCLLVASILMTQHHLIDKEYTIEHDVASHNSIASSISCQ